MINAHYVAVYISDRCFAGQWSFVQPARAVNDERALDVELAEHQRHFLHNLVGKNAGHLRARAGGIRQRAEEVERRAPESSPRGHGVPHGCVQSRREKKPDPNLANRRADLLGRNVERNPQRF